MWESVLEELGNLRSLGKGLAWRGVSFGWRRCPERRLQIHLWWGSWRQGFGLPFGWGTGFALNSLEETHAPVVPVLSSHYNWHQFQSTHNLIIHLSDLYKFFNFFGTQFDTTHRRPLETLGTLFLEFQIHSHK